MKEELMMKKEYTLPGMLRIIRIKWFLLCFIIGIASVFIYGLFSHSANNENFEDGVCVESKSLWLDRLLLGQNYVSTCINIVENNNDFQEACYWNYNCGHKSPFDCG